VKRQRWLEFAVNVFVWGGLAVVAAWLLLALGGCTFAPRYSHVRTFRFVKGDAMIEESYLEHADEKPEHWPW